MLAEELFYRAGGLVDVRPILFEGLMLHASAPLSTALERMPGLAAALLEDHPSRAGDVLIVASNSGSNAVTSELAALARDARRPGRSRSPASRTPPRRRRAPRPRHACTRSPTSSSTTAACVGDAAVEIPGLAGRVAPTSTVVGAAIVNAHRGRGGRASSSPAGIAPEVFTSSNVEGGDALNAALLGRTAAT